MPLFCKAPSVGDAEVRVLPTPVAVADFKPIEKLQVDDWCGAKRLTNVPIRHGLYSDEFFQVTNCHPYHPCEKLGGGEINMQQPVVVEYDYKQYAEYIPDAIRRIVGGATAKLYLNVQDNPWKGNQILLRPHAIQWMFPSNDASYTGVRAYAVKDDGIVILDETSRIRIHPNQGQTVASPPEIMILKSLSHEREQAFYSVVVYNGKVAITRHVFLTPDQCDLFRAIFDPEAREYERKEFEELLTHKWRNFLISSGILPA